MATVTWLGHSAFLVEDQGVRLLIDPFLEGNPRAPLAPRALGAVDVVAVTHDHGDHVGQAVQICRDSGAHLLAVVGTAEKLQAQGIPAAQILNGIGYNMGGTLEFRGMRLTMVPAWHTSESGQPVGYVITLPGGAVVYHAGDTCLFGDMALWGELYGIDLALLPVGGVFTMDAAQAARACALLRTPRVLPMHWGTFPVLAQDTGEFCRCLAQTAPACQCLSVAPGESVTL